MNDRPVWRALAITLFAIGLAAVVGIGAYNAGVTHGLAESGRAVAAVPPGTPYIYMWPHPWGFGFFPFFPLFFVLFLFFALRRLAWGGPWRREWRYRHDGVPPAFEEWHRRAHGEKPNSATPGPTA